MTRYAHLESPLGDLLLIAGEDGRLRGLWMKDQRHKRGTGPPTASREAVGPPVWVGPGWVRDERPFAAAREQLGEYFAGGRTTFELELDLDAGSPFQQRVWRALLDIPHGETRSYGELAMAIGHPGAARAVGLANGRNPIGIVVPCHRVVGADGSLTGYGGGLPRKRWLLEHEAGVADRTSADLLGSRPDGRPPSGGASSTHAAPALHRL
jgi:methylated-DNA-[protein]-cysteine S-methyltransferase